MKDRGALGYLNPLRQPSASIRSRSLGISTNGGYNYPSAFTTSDTTAWQTVFTAYAYNNSDSGIIKFSGPVHLRHTASNALVGIAVYLYTDRTGLYSGVYVNPCVFDNIEIDAKDRWHPVTLMGAWPMNGVILPGTHGFLIACRNYTTGTLSVAQNDGGTIYDHVIWEVIGS